MQIHSAAAMRFVEKTNFITCHAHMSIHINAINWLALYFHQLLLMEPNSHTHKKEIRKNDFILGFYATNAFDDILFDLMR